jgi:hypothetical protein
LQFPLTSEIRGPDRPAARRSPQTRTEVADPFPAPNTEVSSSQILFVGRRPTRRHHPSNPVNPADVRLSGTGVEQQVSSCSGSSTAAPGQTARQSARM